MFSQNPNATPIWILMIFSATSYFGFPRIRKFVSKYVVDENKQRLFTLILWLIMLVVVVSLSMFF